MNKNEGHPSEVGYIGILLFACYFFGWFPSQEYETKKARTVRCMHFHEGHALSSKECFEYARNHTEEPNLVTIQERVFHVSFTSQTVAEIGPFHEARSYSCQVFDVDNWLCPIGQNAKDFDFYWTTESSRMLMKDGDFEEWLNQAIYPIKDIRLNERTTHYFGNWVEFSILRFCLFFGVSCKPSYNIDAEDDNWSL